MNDGEAAEDAAWKPFANPWLIAVVVTLAWISTDRKSPNTTGFTC